MTCLALNQLLNLHLFVGIVFIEQPLSLSARGRAASADLSRLSGAQDSRPVDVAWYDWLLAALTFALLIWFAFQADRILSEGWEYSAPRLAKIFAGILWLLILEGLRRTSGWPMTIIVGLMSLYPVVAGSIPNPLKGSPQSFDDTLAYHLASAESAFGIPMRAFARDRHRLHRVRRRAQLHRRRPLLQRSRLRAGRPLARRRRAGRHHLQRAARLDQRQRDLERDHRRAS